MMRPFASFFCVVAGALVGAVYGGTATPGSGSVSGGSVGGALPPKRLDSRPPALGASSASAGSARAAAEVCSARRMAIARMAAIACAAAAQLRGVFWAVHHAAGG
jgi:hypothetical protein